jgi:hypothetical protein
MLAATDVLHFLANEFTGLGAGGLSLSFIFSCSFERRFLWHDPDHLVFCVVCEWKPRCNELQDLFRIPKWPGRTAAMRAHPIILGTERENNK